ncbi:uncharacterized protein B4U79_02268 [Dinothrombium tinctorium]|uniref:Natterin-3-like protein n=1 Tax=Dinothrombium tinctorium TaxID=1965070 RepID=A0A443QGL1_9ACAR|nr:uncharacterized protein B4U79_12697 [Dinothrombium tinctorium]RWS02173.1 uncharacterized protein B4U79_02268 [Dinothrombium tinctorium]
MSGIPPYGYQSVYPSAPSMYPSQGFVPPPTPGARMFRPVVEWRDASSGAVPVANPVIGGHDVNSEPLYIGSTEIDGDLVPGKVVQSHRCCYVAYAGREHSSRIYHVLVNPSNCELVWQHSSHGKVPTGAIQGGRTADGEPLYIGRHYHDGSLTVGKIHPSHGRLYISFGGEEVPYSEYEVLCCKHVPLM